MGGLIVFLIIIISVFSSLGKKAADQTKNQQPSHAPRVDIPDGEGKWFDEEYYGEGLPPSKDVCDPRGSHGPHTPRAQVSIPEPVQRTREAPKATVKTSLRTASKNADDLAPATIEIAGGDMSFAGDNALRAVLYAEILAKPKALR